MDGNFDGFVLHGGNYRDFLAVSKDYFTNSFLTFLSKRLASFLEMKVEKLVSVRIIEVKIGSAFLFL
jgi:hypothetical protein